MNRNEKYENGRLGLPTSRQKIPNLTIETATKVNVKYRRLIELSKECVYPVPYQINLC